MYCWIRRRYPPETNSSLWHQRDVFDSDLLHTFFLISIFIVDRINIIDTLRTEFSNILFVLNLYPAFLASVFAIDPSSIKGKSFGIWGEVNSVIGFPNPCERKNLKALPRKQKRFVESRRQKNFTTASSASVIGDTIRAMLTFSEKGMGNTKVLLEDQKPISELRRRMRGQWARVQD